MKQVPKIFVIVQPPPQRLLTLYQFKPVPFVPSVFSNTIETILSKKTLCSRLMLNKKPGIGQKYRIYKNKNKTYFMGSYK